MLPLSRMLLFGFLIISLSFAPWANSQELPPQVPEQPGVQVQPRGPVHEGFAQPFDMQPDPGPIVPKRPPETVPELPPEMRPEGKDVQWIPGYWAWDSEKGDYLWISGTYRNAPPGRQYVPGYWAQANNGWRWVQGYWAPASGPQAPLAEPSQYQPQFTPQPPAPLETGPNLPGPQDSIYYPGYWSYQNSNFAWRPGFYAQGNANLIWIPPHYTWTPAGYVFVPGYWDYPFANRGLLFAPVTFASNYWNTPGWNYQPWYALNTGLLINNLFWRGPFFYYGNYYGSAYAGLGYRPWYGARYSPYLGYYRWANRGNPGWYAGLHNGYLARGAGTLAPYGRSQLITPLNRVQQLGQLNQAQIHAQRAAVARSQQLSQQRLRLETGRGVAATVPVVNRPQSVNHAAYSPSLAAPYRANVAPAVGQAAYRAATPQQYHATPAYHAAPAYHANPTYRSPANYHAAAVNHGRAVAPAHHSGSASHSGRSGHRR